MALLSEPQGCKVGWAYYDDEAEAQARGEHEQREAVRRMEQGYDFGYQWPGSVQRLTRHQHGEASWPFVVWMVVTT